jgi:CheY-like chemotaxis protein
MSKDVQDKIFDAFFTTKPTGHGLGLAVVQRIIQGLGGTIQIDSELGSGTTFRILLPSAGEMAQRSHPASDPVEWDRLNKDAIVLLVDDEPSIRSAVGSMLRMKGLCVVEARDGTEALACIRQYKGAVSLIVLDVTLPGAPGYEVVDEARRVRSDVKVVVSSAHGQKTAEASLPGVRFDSFLRKPYSVEDLGSLLKVLVSADDARSTKTGVSRDVRKMV